jgi:hypothetical protein
MSPEAWGIAPGLELLLMRGGGFAKGVRIEDRLEAVDDALLEAIAAAVMPLRYADALDAPDVDVDDGPGPAGPPLGVPAGRLAVELLALNGGLLPAT